MSVIAACSLPDGALLASDCRITIRRPGVADVFVDNVQKIFPIATGTAIGFVGGVKEVNDLLLPLIRKIAKRRCDPVSLSTWIPRLFKYEYSKILARGPAEPVAFMVASALWCRQNIIDRDRVVEIMRKRLFNQSSIGSKFMPAWFPQVLALPPECKHITLLGTPRTAVYAMRSPNFRPECYRPLQIVVIGSGEIARTYLEDVHSAILATDGWMQSFWIRLALRDCVRDRAIDTVGGLYPVIKVKGESIEFLTEQAEIPVGGTKIELAYENHTWIQRNVSSGKEIKLKPPWEIPSNLIRDRKFDDIQEAHHRLSSGQAARRSI